jgi:hypothetical protein
MRLLLSLFVCLCLVACGRNKYGDHPPYPTSGLILVNGKPAAEARVVFHHVGDWGEKSIVPQAWTDEEGHFVLSTYAVEDGAPAGDYKVVVEWPAYRRGKNVGPDRLGGKYSKPDTSGLTAHVEVGENALLPLQLKAELSKVKTEPITELKKGGRRKDR